MSTSSIEGTGLSAAMSGKLHGDGARLHWMSGGKITFHKDGSARVTEKAWCGWSSVFSLLPARDDAHPLWPSLLCDYDNLEVTRDVDIADITIPYAGLLTGGSIIGVPVEDPPEPWTQFVPNDGQTPIEAHPIFESDLAGTAAAPLNGAVFDSKTKLFLGFKGGEGDLAESLRGTQSFYMPGGVFERVSAHKSAPTVDLTPTIVVKPTGCNYVDDAGRNWLTMPATVKKIGGYYQMTERWLLSNPGGWNDSVYAW